MVLVGGPSVRASTLKPLSDPEVRDSRGHSTSHFAGGPLDLEVRLALGLRQQSEDDVSLRTRFDLSPLGT